VIAQTRAELLKIRSTRTTLGLFAGMLALVLLVVVLRGLLDSRFSLSETSSQRDMLGLGSIAALFSALAGVLVVTSEYRYGTIRPTFLFMPRRSRVVSAKLVASLLTGLGFALIAEGLGYGIGRAIFAGRNIPIALDRHDVALLFYGSIVGSALWGGIGVGLGAVLRNQVGSVIGLLAWVFVVDNLLFGLVPSIGKLTPTQAMNAMLGGTDPHYVSPAAGTVLLVAWAVLLAVPAVVLTTRRDVG
jgi:ABC-type transport system involved in multi-copper enzyme maturation permease subunit